MNAARKSRRRLSRCGGKRAPRRRLKSIGKLEQLCLEMVNGIAPIVERAVFRSRIEWIIEARGHASADIEAARRADHADCVETIGILQNFRFHRFRRDVGGKTVGGDRMRNGRNRIRLPAERLQNAGRLLRRERRSLGAQRRAFLDRNAIMEKDGCGQYPAAAAFLCMDAHRVSEDAQDMRKVMRPVIAFGGMGNELGREAFERGKGLGFEHAGHRTFGKCEDSA